MTAPPAIERGRPPLPAATYLATWPAGPGERRFAVAAVVLSVLVFAATAPWAARPLPEVWAFIPLYASALVASDLITALLLFGQARIARSRAVLVLACGYLYTAFATIAHALSFPGLFAPAGLLGGGPQTTAWLYMFWHGGFPLFVIVYTLLSRPTAARRPDQRPSRMLIVAACVATGLVVLGLVALATVGHDALPAIMVGHRYTPAMQGVVSSVWLASLVALGLLWWRRPHAVLDMWLMVVLFAWLLDIALSAVLNAGRFDLGFYAGRAYGLLAGTFVLGVLLLENGRLYAGLVDAHAHERLRGAELRALGTRLESANAQLSEKNNELQEQTRLKSEFLANMAHELRTPLNAVIGFSELLEQASVDPDRQRQFAGHIHQSGHHLLALINDILDLSKIEAGKMELEPVPLHLATALAEAVALLGPQADARQVRLVVDLRGEPGVLRADARRLKQIVLNLGSNAVKFSPAGATVTLGAERVDRRRAERAVPGYRDGVRKPLPDSGFEHYLELSVTDAGPGIAPHDLERLFAPFVQLHGAHRRSGEGTGLGLAMVHRLADLHGGTVAVSSEEGRGSRFTVWLPWRDEEVDAVPLHTMADSRHPPRHRVALVVEDHHEAAALMVAQLEATGFGVRRVASAEAALALSGEFTPDLITLDILLPGMDGWEFLARLKATPAWEAVPVVVVSVTTDEGRSYALGAALVLQKPITGEALAKGLQSLGLAPDEGRQVTVLVIDDDAAAVELLASQLHRRQCLVLRALGGREGIELARRFRPDLIMLDLEMPEVSGFEVVESLRGSPVLAHIPIVVVTARDLSAADRATLNGHVHDIVGKAGFDRGRFSAEVERAMAKVA